MASSIKLRVTIIGLCFIDGITGGIGYVTTGSYILIFAALVLFVGIIYDIAKLNIYLLLRSIKYLRTDDD